jgi:hypothetical protein
MHPEVVYRLILHQSFITSQTTKALTAETAAAFPGSIARRHKCDSRNEAVNANLQTNYKNDPAS